MEEEEDLDVLDRKLKQLKLEYEQYFLGSRPREPALLRGEVQKWIARYSNKPANNTAARFKFSSLCSRFQSLRYRWDETLRQIDAGSYSRHRFKADLHQRERSTPAAASAAQPSASDLFDAYVEARRACGQNVSDLTRDGLDAILTRQRDALKQRYGEDEFRFRVVVEDGRAKLKAARVRS